MLLTWSAIPVGAFVEGLAIDWTHVVAVISVLTVVIPLVVNPYEVVESIVSATHKAEQPPGLPSGLTTQSC